MLGARLGSELGKTGSPRLGSEATEYFDEPKPAPKGKGKSKAKKGTLRVFLNLALSYSDSCAPRRFYTQCERQEGACTSFAYRSRQLLNLVARVDRFAVRVSNQEANQEGKDIRCVCCPLRYLSFR